MRFQTQPSSPKTSRGTAWFNNTQRRNEILWGACLLTPIIVATLVFQLYPIYRSIEITMYNWSGIGKPTQFVGLRHFFNIVNDPWWWNAVRNSVLYAAVLVPVQLFTALITAVALNNPRLRGRILYRGLYFLPTISNAAIMAVVVSIMFGQFGTKISQVLGLPPINPIGDPRFSIWAVIIFGIWNTFGINMVYFMAALQTVPQDLYDAAKVDGATWLEEIIHVTIPGIRPVMIIILFLAIMGSLNVFEASYVLTAGGPYHSSEVVSVYIYNYAFGSGGYSGKTGNLGYASAAALTMSIITLVITGLQLLATREKKTKGEMLASGGK